MYKFLADFNTTWKNPFFFCPYCYDLAELDEQKQPLTEKQQQRYQVFDAFIFLFKMTDISMIGVC